jgi:hypothetical protein
MCCTKWSLVLNLIYSGQVFFSCIALEIFEAYIKIKWLASFKSSLLLTSYLQRTQALKVN